MKHKKESHKSKSSNVAVFVVIALIAGFFGGYILALERADTSEVIENHEHVTDMPHSHGEHMHEIYNYTGENIPSIELIIHEDPKAGWNLELKTQNFKFAPENASLDHIESQGHSHLYINGEKITRIYSNWFHIPELEEGIHEITVDLTTNDHKTYAVEGEIIKDSQTLQVS